MSRLYQSPLRVYLALGALALWGIIAGFQLPVSLFPNSSKPTVGVNLSYGEMSSSEFLNTYGRQLESRLEGISDKDATVDLLKRLTILAMSVTDCNSSGEMIRTRH